MHHYKCISMATRALSKINYSRFPTRTADCIPYHCRYMGGGSYEGDGRTKVSIFNTNPELGLMISGYSQYGFRLNNNMVVMGPIAIFPRCLLSWNVNTYKDVNVDSLSLFFAVQPKIDMLIVGIGDHTPPQIFSKELVEYMKHFRVNVEILRTEQACATFNFLSAEQRLVAAALIPPLHIRYNENDVAGSALKKTAQSF